jgi:type III secretory pathway component EscU
MGALFSSESVEEKENKREMALEKAKQIASSSPVAVFRSLSSLLLSSLFLILLIVLTYYFSSFLSSPFLSLLIVLIDYGE